VAATLLVPLSGLWVVSDNYAYLVGLQLFAGFAWSGFEITAILNFFDCTNDENRARVLSVYNLLNGIGIVTASFLGGILLSHVGEYGYQTIFLVSSGLRAVCVLAVAKGVGVRRQAHEHSFQNVFVRVITLRPGQGPDLRPVVMPEEPAHLRHHRHR
jgi:MFS family permease